MRYTSIAQDQVVVVHLCERCAAAKGVQSPSTLAAMPISQYLGAGTGKGLEVAAILPGVVPGGACPTCGATLNDFRETGRLGCADCYRVFEGPLRDLLRRVHGSSRHLGKRYTPASGGDQPEGGEGERVLQLREQLRLAIETESFELAAELRDRLRALEGEGR